MKKLSEMNANELCKALCDLAEPIGNIARDDEVVEAMQQISTHKKNNAIIARLFGSAYAALIPLLLRKHKADVFSVVSCLSGKPIEVLEQENGFQLTREIRKIFSAELMSFFGSSADMV